MNKVNSIEDYRAIIGDEELHKIHRNARGLYGKTVLHINATYIGGGVAEILNSLVPLMNDAGVDAGWRIAHGSPDFFNVTKSFHNDLQGEDINLDDDTKELFVSTNENFSKYTHMHHDCVIMKNCGNSCRDTFLNTTGLYCRMKNTGIRTCLWIIKSYGRPLTRLPRKTQYCRIMS